MDAPESNFDLSIDPFEESWEHALAALATEEEGASEATSLDPLGELIASIDAAIASGLPPEPPSDEQPKPDLIREGHVLFSLDGKMFAAPIDRTVRFDRIERLTPLPNTPPFVLGVTNIRGDIVPVLDLRQLLGLPAAPDPGKGRLVQLASRSHNCVAGFLVDALHGVRTLEAGDEASGSPPAAIDVEKLFASDPIRGLRGAASP